MALGLFAVLTECLITAAFAAEFTGWSIYPLIVLLLFGMMLIYLAINRSAREMM